MAGRHVWWETPQYWDNYPEHTIAYVLRSACVGRSALLIADQERLIVELGEDSIRYVFATAQAKDLTGIFNQAAWVHWHLRLGISATENDVPPLPKRIIPP